jgi:hypothetical protein
LQITHLGIKSCCRTSFDPSLTQNLVFVGYEVLHFGQTGFSTYSNSKLQPQVWQNFVSFSNSFPHFGQL